MSEKYTCAVSELESESESELESELESDSESIDIPFYENLEETELNDLISSIHELIEDYLNIEILKMAKPDFHEELINDVTNILFQNLQDVDICKEIDYDSVIELVDIQCQIFFENKENSTSIPLRTIEQCKYNYYCEHLRLSEEIAKFNITKKLDHVRLLNESPPKQRTPEWYKCRYNMMTASNLWQSLNTEAQRNRLIYDKCKPLDFGYTENKWVNTDNSLHWGVKYEPLTALIYEKITGAKVEEFGCIQHTKYPFIGASPDGIVTNVDSPLYGRMLEIKNIYNRDMNGIPSEAYWIQIQIQLECCNLDVCDFVETRFKEYNSHLEFCEESNKERIRGMILHFIPKDGKSNVPLYKYMPLDISLNENSIDEWTSQCKSEMPEYAIYTKIYWYLDEVLMSTVERNQVWFNSALPIIKETWETIERERISGYEHRASKKRNINEVMVINTTDGSESQIITNMPQNNGGICLIKIDS
jgi:putative phage-type endonuclease